jgi:hypothetical protein
MRTNRARVVAVLLAALPTVLAAQQGRQFKDAWFWGVKGGGVTFADEGGAYKQAPLAGVEWMITRTHGGLYMSLSQAFMNTKTIFPKDPSSPDSGTRLVDLKNLRKLDIAMMAYPGTHIRFHPYVGLGFSMTQVPTASGEGPFGNEDQVLFTNQNIQDLRVGFTPSFLFGAQWRTRWSSVFAQGQVNPAQKNFLLYNGKPVFVSYEFGVRYNVGSSIER